MENTPSTPKNCYKRFLNWFCRVYNILKVYQSRTPGKCFFSRWRPRWPPKRLCCR